MTRWSHLLDSPIVGTRTPGTAKVQVQDEDSQDYLYILSQYGASSNGDQDECYV